jgi:lysophospholipase L1-like esterase
MRKAFAATALALVVITGGAASVAHADADSATHYYLSLGDSYAAGTNATGDGARYTNLGYADQLHAALAADDPKLELKKLGCPGESAASLRFGSQSPAVVESCGTPRFYKNVLYPKGTQLAEAVSFLHAHKGKVALVTIDIGSNDLSHYDAQGHLVVCLFPPEDCDSEASRVFADIAAILAELRAAAGPGVPILGMTYFNVFAPLQNPVVDARVDALNARLAATYAAAGIPFADVAGRFRTVA